MMITAASPLVGVISDVIWPHLAMITAAVIAAAVQLWPLTITPITDPNLAYVVSCFILQYPFTHLYSIWDDILSNPNHNPKP